MPQTMPNLAGDLRRIHAIITRGLQVATDNSHSRQNPGNLPAPVRQGFSCYLQAFVSIVAAHHLTEDELAFPYFRETMPEMPFEMLMGQHQELHALLDAMQAPLAALAAEGDSREALQALCAPLEQIGEIWPPHIAIEEGHLTQERLGARLDQEEEGRLCRLFAEHSQQHASPDYLVAPFLLYNLPPEERAIFAQALPPILTDQLVPVVWKEQWEPMRPFLLP